MSRRSVLLVAAVLLVVPLVGLSAWDARLLSLNSPSLYLSGAVPSAYSGVFFPTDEYFVGLSAIPDAIDVFSFPQQLGNEKLFPSNSVILDWTGTATGNGGIVLGGGGKGLVLGLFLLRPNGNGWVTGTARAAFPTLGTFYTDSGLGAGATAPTTPTNLADAIVATKLGSMLVGAGLGFSFSQAANTVSSIVNTADSTTTDLSTSWVATGRVGASLPLGSLTLDASGLLLLANASASRVSGAAAAIPNLNTTFSAFNFSFSANARATMSLAQNLDLVALGEFAMLPQNYAGSTAAGGPLTTATVFIDPAGFWSAGGGAGLNWKPADTALVNTLVTVIYGNGYWVQAAVNTTPRPNNYESWITIRPVLDGEFKLAGWITLRGGLSGYIRWANAALNPSAGTVSSTTLVEMGAGADAGLGLHFTDKSELDLLVNLVNWASGGIMGAPSLQTSFKVDL